LETIGILGIGQMGASAAACFSRGGHPVLLWARSEEKLATTQSAIVEKQAFLDAHFGAAPQTAGPIEATTRLEAINERAEVVLECIREDLSQKASLLAQLAPAVRRGAVLTSCTSGLSITAMGRLSGQGHRLVGAHFWNPPHLIPIVEVIAGDQTEPGLVEYTAQLLRSIGKQPVICKDVPGFIGNRLLHALFREAAYLVQAGICSAADVDLVAKNTFGLRLPAVGPCENMDLVGLELVASIQSYLLQDLSSETQVMPILEQMIAEGKMGMATNQGFYRWDEASKRQLIQRRDQQIAMQLAHRHGPSADG
jgi:3-hydroxybutyryl-CoA dehydrogenase